MHLCYSTVFNILKDYIRLSIKNKVKTLFNAIWTPMLQEETTVSDDENSYKYHFGTEIPNAIKTRVKENSIDNISLLIHTKLIPILIPNSLINIIKIINSLLKYDENIDDDDIIIGNPPYTKKEFLSKETWKFEEFIAIILKYVFTNDNEISKSLISDRVNFAKTKTREWPCISIIPFGSSIKLPITVETSKERFAKTFKEISHSASLNLKRDNQLKIFMLDILNNKFDYTNIKKLYKYYLSNYVLSKNEKLKYEDLEELQMKFNDAINKIPKTSEYKESALGNLLLYAFLEQVLKAPKLFNSITLSSSNLKSEAVHMLNVDGKNVKLVFGTSQILNDINTAIISAFNKIKDIELELIDERSILIDSKILNSEFDTDTANLIKNIVIPTNSTSKPTENAFSIFIGYTLKGTDKTLNDENYLIELDNKLQSDINAASNLIKSKIDELDLHGFSFYIYFVPFNNAEIDKLSIVEV